ncbi:uncharacterized protein B0T15DRAFT_531910 [Chaetomium strumarium]|uniref:Uncharacterized protein n=1 Tax=Chaetomium strumarium TaxID=1170767 RepID=A0AAJ0M1A5_9PEZI|nr:hypothetical protein B0T15DRAFT_531910 [Chaetomium strumarium]
MDSTQTSIQQPSPVQLHNLSQNKNLQTSQPRVPQPMNPQKPHPETDTSLGLRGGRSSVCPGRFCFCVPCPLPCDCCII